MPLPLSLSLSLSDSHTHTHTLSHTLTLSPLFVYFLLQSKLGGGSRQRLVPGMAAPAPAPVVDPGKYSTERTVQYVRALVRCVFVPFAPLLDPDSHAPLLFFTTLFASLTVSPSLSFTVYPSLTVYPSQ